MSGGLELPGGPGSRAAREEEARLPITIPPGVHQGVEAEAASEAPSRRGPAPKGAEAEAAWEAAASRLAPSGVSGALAPPQVSFAGDRAKRQKVETSGNLLLSETSGGQHGFTVYADGPRRQGGGADRLPRLQIVQMCNSRAR